MRDGMAIDMYSRSPVGNGSWPAALKKGYGITTADAVTFVRAGYAFVSQGARSGPDPHGISGGSGSAWPVNTESGCPSCRFRAGASKGPASRRIPCGKGTPSTGRTISMASTGSSTRTATAGGAYAGQSQSQCASRGVRECGHRRGGRLEQCAVRDLERVGRHGRRHEVSQRRECERWTNAMVDIIHRYERERGFGPAPGGRLGLTPVACDWIYTVGFVPVFKFRIGLRPEAA